MKPWLNQQLQTLKLVLSRFKKNKLNTLLICLAIGVTLSLPSVAYLVLDSLTGLASEVKSESRISVFLTLDHKDAAVKTIQTALENNKAVKDFQFVSKEDALSKLSDANANKDVLNALEKNPLPDAFFVEPASLDLASILGLKADISKLDGVEEVILDSAWIKRLNYLLTLGKNAMLILACLLGFIMVAVIGNTIRMQILTQLAEIELSRLIGATNSFIRRPFLYAGALYGLIGGLLALAITAMVIALFNRSITPLAAEYQTDFILSQPNFSMCLITCLLALGIGLVSAYFAVSKSIFKGNSSH
jgi:cell division transport system permease protein